MKKKILSGAMLSIIAAYNSSANAEGADAIATGKNSNAKGDYSIAHGVRATAEEFASIAVGDTSTAKGSASIATGNNSNAKGDYSIAHGVVATAAGFSSIAVGDNSTAKGFSSIAVGDNSKAKGDYSIAHGGYSDASGTNSVSIGSYSKAVEKGAVAVGSSSRAARTYTLELINKIKPMLDGKDTTIAEFSIGNSTAKDENILRQITHVAPGIEDTDSVNLYQMNSAIDKKLNDKIGEVDDLNKKITQVEEYYTMAKRSADETKTLQPQTAQYEEAALTAKTNTEKHENNAQTALKETEKHRDKANGLVREIQHEASIIGSRISQDVDTGVIHVGKSLDGNTVSVSGTQGDRVLAGVAEGVRSNDVANIAQLNRVKNTATTAHAMAQKNTSRINNLEHQLFKTNTKIDRGLASSAALTGLFQPYGIGKVNVTAGLGGYGSSQAIAVGTGYRINENAAVKAGLAHSGGNNVMYNAAFNLEW